MKSIEKNKFWAIFTNNGHANGFENCIVSSSLNNTNNYPKIVLLPYEIKNKFEKFEHKSKLKFGFENEIYISPNSFEYISQNQLNNIINSFGNIVIKDFLHLRCSLSKEEYIQKIRQLQNEITKGNIYEINYCIEFTALGCEIDPYAFFKLYNNRVQAPMTVFIKLNDVFIICCSPERFLKRIGKKLIAQPIKGTRKRSEFEAEDLKLKNELLNDEKERSENIMIVDLMRNDLSKIAEIGSVNVDALCEIHSFKNVHQSISTVSCQLRDSIDFNTILRATFPMGSMTGAPKYNAMKLIDKYESSNRELFSGSIGILQKNGDFDLNVVIRTVFYDRAKKTLSFMVGGAITSLSNPEKEYEECLIKADAIIRTFNTSLNECGV